MSAAADARFVPLDGLFNFRDLGGYRTEDGRVVVRGRLYRSDALHRLSPAGAAAFGRLGLVTVLDLRTAAERAERSWRPPPGWAGRRLHLPLLARVPDWSAVPAEQAAAAGFAAEHYRHTAVEGAVALRGAVEALAEPGALPAVFHCAAGKDRTGILAALVLRLLGVPAGTVAEDYALSDAATARWEASVRAGGEDDTAATWSGVPPSLVAAERATMVAFLRGLDDRHGSVAGFAAHLGISDDTVARLRDTLLRA